ncbi:J domain-containing protein [Elizabethkingia meningoseptica]|uniref:J domain-containing protein n=1 Tax=Elizabethkingia meningoseptica TaxID=238 RepID=UPI0020116E96|nr:J domain-containing protein [Elizabethkingia meningoseptica]MCL1674500.1 J domain-containing protein [Elizabethkingia meningoseptica]MCL1686301.1 J domain-containing protein [Elizabethkingia meningoseptica]MDE5431110.1 J domain-containing protein [Elizabethkingia meningoseptica]MDE5437653.1 J domain-containing protein [Elizabethkingia meningoseptica]MDE5507314.1 J domain-containing protein [Elizabethkingia meningoseptica]
MKDYYYFLGIPYDASEEDIRKAYRKLSLKYHPDKSENDPFFESRFREVQEAYNTLNDEDRRITYDHLLSLEQKSVKSNLPPRIKSFHANKIRVVKGEEVIITWQTFDADVVKIHPFGLEKAYGEKKIVVTDFTAEGKFQLILNATNTLLNKTVAHGITITEISEYEREKFPFKNEEQQDIPERKTAETEVQVSAYIKWGIAITAIILVIIYFLMGKN